MNGRIKLGNRIIKKITEISLDEEGPFYLYDADRIRQVCQTFVNIPYSPKSINFAMMANSTSGFLKILKDSGLNIFVNSILHLEKAISEGFRGENIVFAASAMDNRAMLRVCSHNAVLILDSPGQLSRWNSLCPGKEIGIRCNIGDKVIPRKTHAGYFIGSESRLGFDPGEIRVLAGNKQVIGLHVYVGTNITDITYFLDCYRKIAELADLFPGLQFLDFGGGFGLGDNPSVFFDIASYGEKVSGLMIRLSEKIGRKIKLILEPGRIIGGDAGYFICKVVDVKTKNNMQLIGVNASSAQFPRPLFYADSAYHPVNVIPANGKQPGLNALKTSVFGCSTYSRDFLARNIDLHPVNVDDLIVFGYAGAYCAAAYTNFLGFPPVKEIFF